jgi:hypothetical protein
MKALTFFLSMIILAGVNFEAHAQSRTRNNDGDVYVSDVYDNFDRGNDRNSAINERRRFQDDLIRRADRLDNLEYNLQARLDALNGFGFRGSRGVLRSNVPDGLLSYDELLAWENRLNRQSRRLNSLQRDIVRTQRFRLNSRRNVYRRGYRNSYRGFRGSGFRGCRY